MIDEEEISYDVGLKKKKIASEVIFSFIFILLYIMSFVISFRFNNIIHKIYFVNIHYLTLMDANKWHN